MRKILLSIILLCILQYAAYCQVKFVVKSIEFSGNELTKATVLERELPIILEDSIDLHNLNSTETLMQLRLMNLQLFNTVKINTQLDSIAQGINFKIEVSERFPIFPEPKLEFADRNINVWWNEMDRSIRRINIGAKLTHNNMRGRREKLTVIGQIGYTEKVGISYEIPFVDPKKQHGIGLGFLSATNREVAFNTLDFKQKFYRNDALSIYKFNEISAWYTYRPKYASIHTLKVSVNNLRIQPEVLDYNPNYLYQNNTNSNLFSLSYRFLYNQVDNWNYPLKGHRMIGILNYIQFINGPAQKSIDLQMDQYFQFSPQWYGSIVVKAKMSNHVDQSYFFRKNLGFDQQYIRGYEYYVIDGQGFAFGRFDLKYKILDKQLQLPIKYFKTIPIRIYAKTYADVGYNIDVNTSKNLLNNRILYSGGIGFDLVTLYDIKFRFEYTINHLGEKDLYIHRTGN